MNYENYKKEILSNKETLKILNELNYNTILKDYNIMFINYKYLKYLNNIEIEIKQYYKISNKYNYKHIENLNENNISNEYKNILTYLRIFLNLKR